MVKALASIPLVVGAWLTGAWLFMVIVGVVHAHWLVGLPTVGYRTALLVSVLVGAYRFVGAVFGGLVKGVLA